MSEEIYRVVKKYLEGRDEKWRFILGGRVYDKHSLIERMERDREFRRYIIEEVIKTAVDLLLPKE